MTCFNAADTIERAIDSALAQNRDDYEIVIVDDGSHDGSPEVIAKKITGYNHVRLIVHEQNKGFPGTLNTVINAARGEFLVIFDDDDVSVPHRVTTQYERLTNYERDFKTDMVICHAARLQTFPNGYQRYEPTMGTNEGIAPHGEVVAERILTGKLSPNVVGSCANCSRMARISLFKKMGAYDAKMKRAEDTDFNIRLALAGGHFVGVAEPLVLQTMVLSSDKTLSEEYPASMRIIEKHRAYLESKGWYDFCRNWLDIRFDHLNHQMNKMMMGIIKLFLTHPVKVFQKLWWTIPAYKTRRDIRKWHHAAFNE